MNIYSYYDTFLSDEASNNIKKYPISLKHACLIEWCELLTSYAMQQNETKSTQRHTNTCIVTFHRKFHILFLLSSSLWKVIFFRCQSKTRMFDIAMEHGRSIKQVKRNANRLRKWNRKRFSFVWHSLPNDLILIRPFDFNILRIHCDNIVVSRMECAIIEMFDVTLMKTCYHIWWYAWNV